MSIAYKSKRRIGALLASPALVAGLVLTSSSTPATAQPSSATDVSAIQAYSKPSIRAWIGSVHCSSKGNAYVNVAYTNLSSVKGGVWFHTYRNGRFVASTWIASGNSTQDSTASYRRTLKASWNEQKLTVYRSLGSSSYKRLIAKKTGIRTSQCL